MKKIDYELMWFDLQSKLLDKADRLAGTRAFDGFLQAILLFREVQCNAQLKTVEN